MGLTRREWLQQAGLLFGVLGVSGSGWLQLTDRYAQALAQTARRKFALLIGINNYPTGSQRGFKPLQGCVTDVELQRELLQYRFGFEPDDILTLTNAEASREKIEAAFQTHLLQQVQQGDVVVFHFSGYGCSVLQESSSQTNTSDQDQDRRSQEQSVLLAADGVVLPQDTLRLMLRSLPTSWVIAVLDASYTKPGLQRYGSLQIRSVDCSKDVQIDPQEQQLQAELASKLNLSEQQVQQLSRKPIAPIVFTAAKPSQVAAEFSQEGFSAGLFTYALTCTMWSATASETLTTSVHRTASTVEQYMGASQQPQLYWQDILENQSRLNQPILSEAVVADGVIQSVDGNSKTAKVLLTGLPIALSDCCGADSLLKVVPESGLGKNARLPDLLIRSQEGLMAKAVIRTAGTEEIPSVVQRGQLVQENIRVISRQRVLQVGLDPELTRIERVDATSALSGVGEVSIVSGEQPVDYLLGRVRDTTVDQGSGTPLPSMLQGRYGLFSIGQVLIPETVGEKGEAVKVAVQRLTPQLKTRLAFKLLRLTANERSPLLKTRVTLALLAPQSKILMQQETPHSGSTTSVMGQPAQLENLSVSESDSSDDSVAATPTQSIPPVNSQGIITLSRGSRVQYQIQNNGALPIYFILLQLDSRGKTYLLDPTLPPQPSMESSIVEPLHQQRVAVGKTLSLPMGNTYSDSSSGDRIGQVIQGPAGLIETHLVLSHYPFNQTLEKLAELPEEGRGALRLIALSTSLGIARAVLADLSQASLLGVERANISTDDIALDINAWATFSFVCRVV